jgi:hypothetical protein
MKTILAYGGFRAFAELVRRMLEPEADGVAIEIGHGSSVTLILLRVGDFQVALESEQADAALAGLLDARAPLGELIRRHCNRCAVHRISAATADPATALADAIAAARRHGS